MLWGMSCLLLDASSDLCLIALAHQGRLLRERVFAHECALAQTLLPALCQLLEELPASSLDCIAVGVGPGSYTGIRIAASVAMGLALPRRLPLIEFCSPLAFTPSQAGRFASVMRTKSGRCFVLKGEMPQGDFSPFWVDSQDALEEALSDGSSLVAPSPNLSFLASHTYERFMQGAGTHPPLHLIYMS